MSDVVSVCVQVAAASSSQLSHVGSCCTAELLVCSPLPQYMAMLYERQRIAIVWCCCTFLHQAFIKGALLDFSTCVNSVNCSWR
jgi:hypothetical protein